MASKRKRNQGENNSSDRNLDGRRLRTVNEAKALAEYLALKPEMEKKEKEARRRRWEQVVDIAERREDEIRNGAKGKVDGKWVEDKEEAGEWTREAVLAVMKSGGYQDNLKDSIKGNTVRITERTTHIGERDVDSTLGQNAIASASKPVVTPTRSYLGFDDDNDFMSESEEGDAEYENELVGDGKGKGKDSHNF